MLYLLIMSNMVISSTLIMLMVENLLLKAMNIMLFLLMGTWVYCITPKTLFTVLTYIFL